MPVNASRVKTLLDVASTVLLRNIEDAAETSTTTETAVSLGELDTAYWDNGDIPAGVLQFTFVVSAIDATTGDESYTLSLVVDDTSDMSNTPVTVWSQAIANTFTGVLYAYVDADNIPRLDTDSSGTDKWIAAKATLGGTSPSITYGCHMSKSLHQ